MGYEWLKSNPDNVFKALRKRRPKFGGGNEQKQKGDRITFHGIPIPALAEDWSCSGKEKGSEVVAADKRNGGGDKREMVRAAASHIIHKPTSGRLKPPSAPSPPGPPVTTNAQFPTGRSPRYSKGI